MWTNARFLSALAVGCGGVHVELSLAIGQSARDSESAIKSRAWAIRRFAAIPGFSY